MEHHDPPACNLHPTFSNNFIDIATIGGIEIPVIMHIILRAALVYITILLIFVSQSIFASISALTEKK